MDTQTLSDSQLRGFSITERTCSVFSLLGSILVISTFCASKSFRKPINRLVFYASFGNMMTNVATLMARSYIDSPQSPGCQFQAFLIQMFMPADAFWTLAMAINVYLTFYRKFDARKLRRMEAPYLAFCYGVPFVVALTYVFVNDPRRGRMYGNATLWCWVSSSWDVWRIATFYGPVWAVILVTFFVYIRAGREIYLKHKQLRDFQYSSHPEPEPPLPTDSLYGASKAKAEVVITTEIVSRCQQGQQDQQDIDLSPLGRRCASAVMAGSSMPAVEGAGPFRRPRSQSAAADDRPAVCLFSITSDRRAESAAMADGSNTASGVLDSRAGSLLLTASEADAVSGAMASTTAIATPTATTPTIRNPASQRMRRRAAYEANSAAWSYAKCALLFFTALLVTWIPSSANRVFSVVHVDQVSAPLEYMSAFVLPLQGFWNAIIYVVTSWKAVRTLWDEVAGDWWCRHHKRGRQQHQQLQPDIRQTNFDANAAQISRDSDEMLVHTIGGHYAGSSRGGSASGRGPCLQMPSSRGRSEQSCESESVKDLSVVHTLSRGI